MPYLSKEAILKAYKKLSTINTDPSSQGATQNVSGIRYFVALDGFFHETGRNCDTKDRNDRDLYIKHVGKVVGINEKEFTNDFYYPLSLVSTKLFKLAL
jgi:hypothetical protein